MSPKERELRQEFAQKTEEARRLADEGKLTEARSVLDSAKELKEKIDLMVEARGGIVDVDNSDIGIRSLGGIIQRTQDKNNSGIVVGLLKEQRMADIAKPYTIDGEQRQLSIGKYVRGIVTGNWDGAEAEKRAMSEGALSGGGYLVPSLLSSQVIDLSRNQARVIQAGAVTVPMESNKLTLAKVATPPKAGWKKENESIAESNTMTLGAVNMEAKTLVGMMRMSIELLEDAANIDSVISTELSESLALELDRAAMFGKGENEEPRGVYHTPGIQKIDMGENGGAIQNYTKFSEAVEMVQNVNGEANGVIWSPRTAGAIDRLADTTGQPLRAPASYENLSKFATNQVPNDLTKGTAQNASVALVGDWSQLLIGTRTNLILEASREGCRSL